MRGNLVREQCRCSGECLRRGGPAGLECARTAALRGHDVTLVEGTRQLGGQVAIAAAVTSVVVSVLALC